MKPSHWLRFASPNEPHSIRLLSEALVVSLMLGTTYAIGLVGGSAFVRWGLPQPPVIAAIVALAFAGRVGYTRGAPLAAGVGGLLIFASVGAVNISYGTAGPATGFVVLILGWAVGFGAVGYALGSVSRYLSER